MDIIKVYQLPFAKEDVYSAWVSSKTVISPATSMDIKPEVGGHYRLLMDSDDFTSRNEGVFLAVQVNERVHYTWEWNNDGEISEIEVEFISIPMGTEIKLLHTGFTKQQSADMHSSGWDSYIKGLSEHLTTKLA